MATLPKVEALARELGELATFWSVSIDEAAARDRVRAIAEANGIPPRRLAHAGLGISDPVWRLFGSMPEARGSVPFFVLLDQDGVLRFARSGAQGLADVEQAIRGLARAGGEKLARRPDYSGRWHFDPATSALQIESPEAMVFTIEHDEPLFRIERIMTSGGHTDTFAIDLTVGTDPAPIRRGDATLYPTLRWDGNQLVFLTRIVRSDEEATNVVRYRIDEAGTVLIAEESFRSPTKRYDNRWVFTRE